MAERITWGEETNRPGAEGVTSIYIKLGLTEAAYILGTIE